MMKTAKALGLLAVSLLCFTGYTQDIRTLETKIADLLVQMPVENMRYRDRLARETLDLGREGLVEICSSIIPPGTGDDTRERFAVESLSKYLSREKPTEQTENWESVCIEFLKNNEDPYVKSFFMGQLKWIGGKATVEALVPYIGDDFLSQPAMSAMKQAHSENAGKVILDALDALEGNKRIRAVNTLGELRSDIANPSLHLLLAENEEPELERSILRALALIGNPESYKTLSNAAASVNYLPEPSGATASFLEYAVTLANNGNTDLSQKACRQLIKKCKTQSQSAFKSSALTIYVSQLEKADATTALLGALKNPHKDYRMSAVNLAIETGSPAEPWVKKLSSEKKYEIQAELLYLLGRLGYESSAQAIRPFLDSPAEEVRTDAVASLAVLEGSKAVETIARHMIRNPGEKELMKAKSVLLSVAGTKDLGILVELITASPEPVQASFLQILAAKGDPDWFGLFLEKEASNSPEVRKAALGGLKKTAGAGDLEVLLRLLRPGDDPMSVLEIQEAILVSAKAGEDAQLQAGKIIEAMERAEDESVYIPLLSGLGGEICLDRARSLYKSGTKEQQAQAFKALIDWSDPLSIPVLYDIFDQSGPEEAFEAYLKQVVSSDHTADQKLLLIRKITSPTLTAGQMTKVISACSRVKSFLSLAYVSGWMEEGDLGRDAARAVIDIALPSAGMENGLTGELVRGRLIRALEILAGRASEYLIIDVENYLKSMPDEPGFISLFNGQDLKGWQGLVENPVSRSKMDKRELDSKQAEANELMRTNWTVSDGMLVFRGEGYDNICSTREYGDFELLVDWKIGKKGDSGIYLRGSPQVQIWDPSRVEVGAQVGSGGLYNNKVHPSDPLTVADNPVSEWNTFRILMTGDKVTVYLNGKLVADRVVMENYWDRNIPIFPEGAIELQAHGTDIAFRDIYVREIRGAALTAEEENEGFQLLFNGRNLEGWIGDTSSYVVEDGVIAVKTDGGGRGNLYTDKEYSDFVLRLEFKLTPGANNGLGIRAPLEGNAAYAGMEFQVLDNTAPVYANLLPYQYHGSVYGIIPARRGYLRPVGQWNEQEVIVNGTAIKITLNGTPIVDGDIAESIRKGTLDGKDHPGLSRKTGHIGFLGHGSVLWYRNLRLKELNTD